jgi:hypothetical protein
MTISVCPADEINASVDQVWSLLESPARFDAWWDARVVAAVPPGPMAPGQHIEARAKGIFPARVQCDVTAVDAVKHQLQMTARLPFGVVDHLTFTVTPIGPDRSLVRFG